jgi:hypothetical protein
MLNLGVTDSRSLAVVAAVEYPGRASACSNGLAVWRRSWLTAHG